MVLFLPFLNLTYSDGTTWYYCTLCHYVKASVRWETTKAVGKYMKKNISRFQNHVLPRHAKGFNIFLWFMGLHKTSQPDNASELSMNNISRNQGKYDEISVAVRLSN